MTKLSPMSLPFKSYLSPSNRSKIKLSVILDDQRVAEVEPPPSRDFFILHNHPLSFLGSRTLKTFQPLQLSSQAPPIASPLSPLAGKLSSFLNFYFVVRDGCGGSKGGEAPSILGVLRVDGSSAMVAPPRPPLRPVIL